MTPPPDNSRAPAPTRRPTKEELREDKLTTGAANALTFANDNRGLLIGVAVAVVLGIVLLVGYGARQEGLDTEAATLLSRALVPYEAAEYQAALDGTDGNPGLVAIADDYGSTDQGRLAAFYAGNALYELGRMDEALEQFRAYGAEESVIGASALAARASIAEARGEYDDAAELYERAAEAYPTAAAAPEYLVGAARAYEADGDYAAARGALETLRDEYGTSALANEAEVTLARLAVLAGE
jgi:tetratricopeptide (TPR) repeat protein